MSANESILDTLQTIIRYYGTNRNVGHTRAQIDGIASIPKTRPKTLVIVGTYEQGQNVIPRSAHAQLIPVYQVSQNLRGRGGQPLVIEHVALTNILEQAANEIRRWESAYNETLAVNVELERQRQALISEAYALKKTIRDLTPLASKSDAFLEWAGSHPKDAPPLSDEAISRESIYTREDEQLDEK